MLVLEEKYVLHIPSYKYVDGQLKSIVSEKCINNLITELNNNAYHSFYKTNVKGYYKKRCFDEILITIFAPKENLHKKPSTIFIEWFREHNHILKQESMAYEYNNSLHIITL
ncbi:MAG: hypothetical protein E7Z85_07495 [Methanosphaera stadtmanae]|jgi:hypothetical protein|nr:hypothetical protein [Methanosphaera stadtmanae]